MRRLAHIETILDILPHNNADALEICKILGWILCIRKGEFQKNQTVVLVEPDSILPPTKSEWEFMKDRGYRLKTVKLRGVISQGLIFPLSILPEGQYEIGQDVTELLGITRYLPYVPAQLSGLVKGSFPEFLNKTDEERIQNVPELLEMHKDKKFYVTEKLDGSSMTVYLNNGEFGVCSRNQELKETETNSFWKTARELDLEKKMNERSYASIGGSLGNFSLQGELVGPGVQGNKYKLEKLNFFVFNVYNIDKGRYLCYDEFKQVVETLGLTSVPLVGMNYTLPATIEELVFFSKGQSVLNSKSKREGVVIRPLVEEFSPELRGRLSFKAINPEFLLEHDSE